MMNLLSHAYLRTAARGPHQASERPDDRLAPLLEGIRFRPVFIMGDHRSGTTLLYQLLAGTGLFHYVSAYHVIRYHSILDDHLQSRSDDARRELAECFAARGLSSRLLDNVAVTPDLPEEYGFLLPADRHGRAVLDARGIPTLVDLCRKLRLVAEQDRPVLLKNPWDYGQFLAVKGAFPDARFIFLHRHPARVIDSQLRAARSLYQARNPYLDLLAPWYRRLYDSPIRRRLARRLLASGFGLNVTIKHVKRVNQYWIDHVEALPERDHVSIRYEDLCTDPSGSIGLVLDHLGLGHHDRPSPGLRVEARNAALLPEVTAHLARIGRELSPYLSRWAYSHDCQ